MGLIIAAARKRTGAVRFFVAALIFLSAASQDALAGGPCNGGTSPSCSWSVAGYPAPIGTGSGSTPYIAQSGGETWAIWNVGIANYAAAYYGPAKDGIDENSPSFSFVSATSTSATTATLIYSPGSLHAPGYQQRFLIDYDSAPTASPAPANCPNVPLTLVNTSDIGVPDDGTIGVLAQIGPGACLALHMRFQVCPVASDCTNEANWAQAYSAFGYWDTISHPYNTDFTGTAYANNSAPTVGTVAPQVVGSPGPSTPVAVGPLGFTVGDDGDPGQLTIGNAKSTDATVVDPSSITFTHSGTNATISFSALGQPVGGSGMTHLSFDVSDGLGATTTGGFDVTVNGDTAPTIGNVSPSSLVIQESATSPSVAFQVGDAETDPGSLVVTATSDTQGVIADAGISLGGSGANRTVQVTSAGPSGTANITIKVSDGTLTATTSLPVRVNAPPVLTTNVALAVAQGGSGTITQTQLESTDNPPAAPGSLTYLISGQPHNGTLYLNGVAGPGLFTQADIDAAKVTYTNGGSCSTSDDFQFQVEDVDGGFASDSGFTTFSFHFTIAPTETAPGAQAASYSVALGGSTSQSMQATSSDCGPPPITFQLAASPMHGNLTTFNSTTGAFTYKANSGYAGGDSFQFTATTYGDHVSTPATISLIVQNQPPVAQAGTLATQINTPASGVLVATDPDLPAQTLTYSLATAPTKGHVNIDNVTTGAYTYAPNANAFGADSFTFTANDGHVASAPAAVSVQVRPYPKAGDVLVTDGGDNNANVAPSVVLIDPVTGQQAIYSQDAQYTQLYAIAATAEGRVFVTGGASNAVFLIDPATGAASLFASPGFELPLGLAIEANGNLLVADAMLGIVKRLNGSNGAVVGSAISLGANTAPSGVAVASDTSLWVTDLGGAFGGPSPNALWHVNADGTLPTAVSTGNHLDSPVGIALGTTQAYVSTVGPLFAPGSDTNLVSIDLGTGTQTLLAANGNLIGSPGVTLNASQQLFVTSLGNSSVQSIATSGGPLAPLSANGLLHAPFGIAVVPSGNGVDLAITLTRSGTYLPDGGHVQFTVVVSNTGTQSATGATLSDALPGAFSGVAWTCIATGGAHCAASGAGDLADTVNVPVGGTLTYTLTANVAAQNESAVVYVVSIAPPSGVTDVNLNNNTALDDGARKIFANGFD